jgi:hypothetical protein
VLSSRTLTRQSRDRNIIKAGAADYAKSDGGLHSIDRRIYRFIRTEGDRIVLNDNCLRYLAFSAKLAGVAGT